MIARASPALCVWILAVGVLVTDNAFAVYALPGDRTVVWQGNVGVAGDIPVRATACARLSPSGADDTAAIRSAITACPPGQVVQLNAGTFSISSPIDVKSDVTLRGAGMGATILKGLAGMSGRYFMAIMTSGYYRGAPVSLAGGYTKGSTTITTTTAHGWTVGDLILIDQLNDPLGTPMVTDVGYNEPHCTWCGRADTSMPGEVVRALGQISKVVAVPTATSATLEIPLYWSYSASLVPQGTKLQRVTRNAGIEDLTVDNSLSGSSNQDSSATILMSFAASSWLLRVEAIGSYRSMIQLLGTYRNTVRGCKVHEGIADGGGPSPPPTGTSSYAPSRAYGIAFYTYNSAALIENNEVYHLAAPIILAGANSGNVIAYNAITDSYISGTNWQSMALSFHGAHALMNLVEGNFCNTGRFVSDMVHGSTSHITYFRNRVAVHPARQGGRWDIDIHARSSFFNVVGNVLGVVGTETVYEFSDVNFSWGVATNYRFGYVADGDATATPNTLNGVEFANDSRPYDTVLRHRNWDSVSGGVRSNGDDPILPASLYRSAKPSFMGPSTPWPPIGPDVTPMFPTAPAAGAGTPWGAQLLVSPPTNVRVQ